MSEQEIYYANLQGRIDVDEEKLTAIRAEISVENGRLNTVRTKRTQAEKGLADFTDTEEKRALGKVAEFNEEAKQDIIDAEKFMRDAGVAWKESEVLAEKLAKSKKTLDQREKDVKGDKAEIKLAQEDLANEQTELETLLTDAKTDSAESLDLKAKAKRFLFVAGITSTKLLTKLDKRSIIQDETEVNLEARENLIGDSKRSLDSQAQWVKDERAKIKDQWAQLLLAKKLLDGRAERSP